MIRFKFANELSIAFSFEFCLLRQKAVLVLLVSNYGN